MILFRSWVFFPRTMALGSFPDARTQGWCILMSEGKASYYELYLELAGASAASAAPALTPYLPRYRGGGTGCSVPASSGSRMPGAGKGSSPMTSFL